ncbi:MAG TPA: rhodanese-like domain-containing protein [Vicinamibacterales bacterium]|jgi:rhodanese-related sulfurtransferase|nr:rhodanese-like domain-containing protein [Vicinamibacterales bacterium]
MAASVQELLAAANAAVPKLKPEEVREMTSRSDVVFIDVRDTPEIQQTGKIRGAIHIPRGMIEFRADQATTYHNPALQKDRTIVLYCASGGRSALAGKTLRDMGYTSVYNAGGIKELTEAGLPTEPA